MSLDQKELDKYLTLVKDELVRASAKHGPFVSARHGHSAIEEEYDEFWDAIKADDIDHAKVELVQVAAMCIRFLIDIK